MSVVEGVPQPPSKAPGRLLLWLGLVVALGLGVGAAALSWRAYSSELGRREDGLEASAQLAAKSLDQFFSSRITLLESIARLPGTRSGDPVLITPGLDAVATEDNGFAVGMGYIDSEGLLRVQSTAAAGTPLPVDLSDREYVNEVLETGQPTVSDVILGRLTRQPIAAVAVPVFAPDGSVQGVLSASVLIERLADFVPFIQSDDGKVLVIDGSGQVVLDDGEATKKPISEPSALGTSTGSQTVKGPGVLGDPDRVTSSSPVPTPGWRVAVEASAAVMEGEPRSVLIQQLVVIVVMTLVGIIAMIWAMRRSRAAHGKMARATRTLGALEDLAASTTQAEDRAAVATSALEVFSKHFRPAALAVSAVDVGQNRLAVLTHDGDDGDDVDHFRYLSLDSASLLTDACRSSATQILTAGEYRSRYPAVGDDANHPERMTGAIACRFLGPQSSGAVSMLLDGPFPPSAEYIELFEIMVSLLGEALSRATSAEIERSVSATFQRALLPRVDLPVDLPVQCAARYVPAEDVAAVGGDWFDIFALDGRRVAVVVGDVVGRGVAAAAVMGQLRSAVRAFSNVCSTPAETLSRLDEFSAQVPGAFGATVVVAVVDPARGRLSIASAGHPPPLLATGNGVRMLADVRGTPLGFDISHRGRTTSEVSLQFDDTLVLYTDGLVERRTEIIDVGLERLTESVAAEIHLPVQSFADALLRRCMLPESSDDVALVCLRPVTAHPTTFSEVFPARLDAVKGARGRARAWLVEAGIAEDVVADVVLAISEATTNAVRHAYRDAPAGDVVVEVERRGAVLVVTVRDDGLWLPAAPGSPGGRGLGIIGHVSRHVELERRPDGTTLRFIVDVAGGGAGPAVELPTDRADEVLN